MRSAATSLKFTSTDVSRRTSIRHYQLSPLELLKRRKNRLLKLQTNFEAMFAFRLRQSGVTYQEQVIIGRYIVDFLIPAKMAIVELDGSQHWMSPRQRDHDRERDAFLQTIGFTIFRIPNAGARLWDISQLAALPDRTDEELHNAYRKGVIQRNEWRRRVRPRKAA